MDVVQRRIELEEQRERRREGNRSLVLGPVPVESRSFGSGLFLPGPRANGDNTESGRKHQSLLGTDDDGIDTPRVHFQWGYRKTGHSIGNKYLALASDKFADLVEFDQNSRGALTPRNEDHVCLGPLLERVLHILECRSVSPIHIGYSNRQPVALSDMLPTFGKRAANNHENLIAGRRKIRDRRLHGAASGRRKEENIRLRSEQRTTTRFQFF